MFGLMPPGHRGKGGALIRNSLILLKKLERQRRNDTACFDRHVRVRGEGARRC